MVIMGFNNRGGDREKKILAQVIPCWSFDLTFRAVICTDGFPRSSVALFRKPLAKYLECCLGISGKLVGRPNSAHVYEAHVARCVPCVLTVRAAVKATPVGVELHFIGFYVLLLFEKLPGCDVRGTVGCPNDRGKRLFLALDSDRLQLSARIEVAYRKYSPL